jgi:hypothetical protein
MCCEKPLKAKDIRIESVELNDAGDLHICIQFGRLAPRIWPARAFNLAGARI